MINGLKLPRAGSNNKLGSNGQGLVQKKTYVNTVQYLQFHNNRKFINQNNKYND